MEASFWNDRVTLLWERVSCVILWTGLICPLSATVISGRHTEAVCVHVWASHLGGGRSKKSLLLSNYTKERVFMTRQKMSCLMAWNKGVEGKEFELYFPWWRLKQRECLGKEGANKRCLKSLAKAHNRDYNLTRRTEAGNWTLNLGDSANSSTPVLRLHQLTIINMARNLWVSHLIFLLNGYCAQLVSASSLMLEAPLDGSYAFSVTEFLSVYVKSGSHLVGPQSNPGQAAR